MQKRPFPDKFLLLTTKTTLKKAKMTDITQLFCSIDDFWMKFEPEWKKSLVASQKRPPRRKPSLCESEIMTIIIFFHISGFRNFKTFYKGYLLTHLKPFFPRCPSYNRFLELKGGAVFPLYCYFTTLAGRSTGVSFVDSTSLGVCHPKREKRHKVFKGLAKKGKTSTGWFFGFKLHLIVNDRGEILTFVLTPGNIDDRTPVKTMAEQSNLIGKLVGDRGYISSQLSKDLFLRGVKLITRIRKNMKNKIMELSDKLFLRKRGIIETIIDQLKNISQIEHSRHRSPTNFLANLIAGLIAYSHQPKKPSLHVPERAIALLQAS